MVIPKIIAAALVGVMALASTAGQASAQSADTGPLQFETKIPLGHVRGRIDHMAVDLKRQRLFVAELGNDSGRIEFGSDADNIRVDAAANRIFIGYGSGAL